MKRYELSNGENYNNLQDAIKNAKRNIRIKWKSIKNNYIYPFNHTTYQIIIYDDDKFIGLILLSYGEKGFFFCGNHR